MNFDYNLHLLDEDFMIEIDFVVPLSDKQLIIFNKFLLFFKDKRCAIQRESLTKIDGILCDARDWALFLLSLDFRDNAKAFGEIYNDLHAIQLHRKCMRFFEVIPNARIIHQKPGQYHVKDKIDPSIREHLENLEIKKRREACV